jgi:translation elongation factor aEF-1 beta
MGDVLSIIRVMPTDPEVDLKKVAAEIQKLKPRVIEEKPVAFGIKCLEVRFVRPDKEGGTDALEDQMRKIKGVESVEVTGVTLVS